MSNPQIACPQCGVINELNDTQCWKCKRPITDEEKQKALSELPEEQKEQYLQREARKTAIANDPVSAGVASADYRTSILVAKIVSAVGWLTCVVAVIIVISAFASGGKMGALAIAPGLGVLIGGLILVIAGQSSRALMDNANYSRLMFEEMRRRS